MGNRIYLDNAATSWPKPESVYTAIDEYQRINGAASGRGAYRDAAESGQLVMQARTALKRMIGAASASELFFTFNATDGLNTCLLGFINPGDHVVTSVAEHNSILRPLSYLQNQFGVRVSYVDTDDMGRISADALKAAMLPETRLVALSHASNVTGCIHPIDELVDVAHSTGARVLIDAAQTVGHLPVNVAKVPIDMLVASGHKGLMGPLGTGFVYLTAGVAADVRPLRYGGTGTSSQSDWQPTAGSERFESGNLNMPGIVGLLAACEYHAVDDRQLSRAIALSRKCIDGLRRLKEVKIVGPTVATNRIGLVSFTVEGYDCHDVASILDSTASVQVRSGLHCAPRMHKRLGLEGTVRASWGAFTRECEVELLINVLRDMTQSPV